MVKRKFPASVVVVVVVVVVVSYINYYWGGLIKDSEMGGTCSTDGRDEIWKQLFG
jgi:hypothetical protein